MKTPPREGNISPVNILNVDVLPAPFTPTRPKHSPRGTTKLIPRIQVDVKLNFLTKSSTSKNGGESSAKN